MEGLEIDGLLAEIDRMHQGLCAIEERKRRRTCRMLCLLILAEAFWRTKGWERSPSEIRGTDLLLLLHLASLIRR